MKQPKRTRHAALAAVGALALLATACGDDGDEAGSSEARAASLRLIAYDSFVVPEDAFTPFTDATGIEVEISLAGDAGEMVSKAALTAGNPEGDVIFGIDNTLLSRAIDADVLAPHTAADLSAIPDALTALVPGAEATPVDFGDVCVNYDIAWFEDEGLEPPLTLDALIDPAYRDLLVVENPATSSPGLAFVMATVAAYGAGWTDYWTALRDNGVKVVDGWEQAYYTEFSGSSGKGPRPLVVSYASSPPAEVIFADPPRTDAPTAVSTETCFRQIEFAGILRGTDHPDEAGMLVDYLVSAEFQQLLPLNLFVYPARADVELPAEFTTYAAVPEAPFTLPPDEIAAKRAEWVDEWTAIVLR